MTGTEPVRNLPSKAQYELTVAAGCIHCADHLFSNENSASDKDVKIDFVSKLILVRNAWQEFILILFTLSSKLNFPVFPILGRKKYFIFSFHIVSASTLFTCCHIYL